MIHGKTEELRERPAAVPLLSSQIPHELNWVRAWASMVKSW
jgi:hypothetical protein